MTRRVSLRVAPRELRSLFRDGAATGLTDKELLDRFATCRDAAGELAFATLVARPGPMVFNVSRRMLREPIDAEDAFQATFLVLVRRAASIGTGASLGPWLYGVSVRVARRARNVAARRGRSEGDNASFAERPQRGPERDHDDDLQVDCGRSTTRWRRPCLVGCSPTGRGRARAGAQGAAPFRAGSLADPLALALGKRGTGAGGHALNASDGRVRRSSVCDVSAREFAAVPIDRMLPGAGASAP
jgi:hypothetical protein